MPETSPAPPRKVVLFSGHMIDAPGRETPRFPPDKELVAARAEPHVALRELGPTQEGEDPYERNNRWMLGAANRFGANKVDFVCLWNGEGGDGPGGTKHMMEAVRSRGGRTVWLDTMKL